VFGGFGQRIKKVNGRAIDEILGRYPSWAQPQTQLEALGGAGGLSGASLWRYRALSGRLVLRAWPADGPGRARLERIHRWLFMLSDLGFIPVPIRDQTGGTLQDFADRLWELTPWLPGTADAAGPPGPIHLRASFEGLAALHQKVVCEQVEGVSPGLRKRYETVSQLVDGGLDSLEKALCPPDILAVTLEKAAHRWLKLARIVAPLLLDPLDRASAMVVRVQPCLRDARPEHFLFDGDRLSGVVDFGAMAVDSVAGDLARLIGDWLGDDAQMRREALAAYEQIRPLEPIETVLTGVFEKSADLLIGERWIRWHYLEGRRFDDARAVARGIDRGLSRLERVARALQRGRLAE
jgi:homoserine kinase type II